MLLQTFVLIMHLLWPSHYSGLHVTKPRDNIADNNVVHYLMTVALVHMNSVTREIDRNVNDAMKLLET